MRALYVKIFPSPFASLGTNWKNAWLVPGFRFKAPLSVMLLIGIGLVIPVFFTYIQQRHGLILNDQLLNLFAPVNVSWIIFPVIYTSLLLTFLNLLIQPALFIRAVQAFSILLLIRITCLYSVPLEPAIRYIPLEDPFLGKAFYSGTVITKDLFFSGHVSTMCMLWLVNPAPALRRLLLATTVLIACLMLIQHVHYTADVLAAPIFAWISYRLAVYGNPI